MKVLMGYTCEMVVRSEHFNWLLYLKQAPEGIFNVPVYANLPKQKTEGE